MHINGIKAYIVLGLASFAQQPINEIYPRSCMYQQYFYFLWIQDNLFIKSHVDGHLSV